MQLFNFRSRCATEVSGSFSLRCAYFVEIIHVWHETNFGSTRVLIYCSPPSRITAKSPVLCPLGNTAASDGSYGSTAGEGTGRWPCLYPPNGLLLCSDSTVASQHTAGGCFGSVPELVKMQLYDFISHTA